MEEKLKLIIPKGRIFEKIRTVMKEAGYDIINYERDYRPDCNIKNLSIKILKPQNIAKLVELGQHDLGFTGKDWIIEKNAEVEEILDLDFDPVRIIVAVPEGKLNEILKKDKIIVASEYLEISKQFLDRKGWSYVLLQTHGATEVFPPEDADMIIDNTSTGKTLLENKLEIIDEVMTSSTRLIANKEAMQDPWKRKKIQEIKMMIESVLLARKKILLEMNVSKDKLEQVIKVLPSMKSPTLNQLKDGGYAVKSVVDKKDIASIIPILKKAGATDILEYDVGRIVL